MGIKEALIQLRGIGRDIDKYLYLRELQRTNEPLFYQLLLLHTEEILPYVYTPTVGEACEYYHQLPMETRGLYLRATDAGSFLQKLKAWPQQNIRVVVVTDGERILGLGDLGAGGMGISEGKILLYTAGGGVPPDICLPVCLDLGTNNQRLLNDPAYKGLRQKRLDGAQFDAIMEEFTGAVKEWQPHLFLQFEDFGNTNAFRVLETYRPRMCCMNDDIQGTACITLAGLLSALRATGKSLLEQRVLFMGAGEAGTGIGELIAIALEKRHGISCEQAREHCMFMDSKGLVCASRRKGLQHHKIPFAHELPFQPDLLSAVRVLKPTALIGVSTIAGAFSPEVLAAMAELNERPIIFPLSNPTSKAECTFKQAWDGTEGRVLFACGSPFPPIAHKRGQKTYATQANNAYVFPALGFAAVLTQATTISDDAFLVAAEALAYMTTLKELDEGLLFPRFTHIYSVSAMLTAQVAEHIVASGEGSVPPDFEQVLQVVASGGLPAGVSKWEAYVRHKMFKAPALSRM